MDAIKFRTADFEGPLDLLLHLIAKNRMKLYEIRIIELIDQYVAIVGQIGPEELDGASEFVEMAARLIYLKSVALLPKSEEAEQLERELTGQLVEYSLCKQAARRLGLRAEGVQYFVREPQKQSAPTEYSVVHSVQLLIDAFSAMSLKSARRREPDSSRVTGAVAYSRVSVTSRVVYILKGLRTGGLSRLEDMFAGTNDISQAVATFLALLELVRSGRVAVDSDNTVYLHKKEGVVG